VSGLSRDSGLIAQAFWGAQ